MVAGVSPRLAALPASLVLLALTAADALAKPAGPGGDEAPPGTAGLFVGLALLTVALVGVPLGLYLQRQRRERPPRLPRVASRAVAGEAARVGLAVQTLRADAEELVRQVQQAWDARDDAVLRRLVAPELLASWERHRSAAEELWASPVVADGPVEVELLGLDPLADAPRVALRVQARLEGWAPRAAAARPGGDA
jgi:hypothetical protein